MSDRERLIADLELLGILADPTRGPLARVYAPPPPKDDVKAQRALPLETCRRLLMAALERFKRVRTTQPAPARHLQTNAVPNR